MICVSVVYIFQIVTYLNLIVILVVLIPPPLPLFLFVIFLSESFFPVQCTFSME